VIPLAVAACGFGPDQQGERVGKGGGTLVVAITQDPGSLDPRHSVTAAAGQLVRFAYDSLVNIDASGTVKTGLASAWKRTGQSYEFTIRKDVTCADGARVTPSLIARNLDYVVNPKNESPLVGLYVPAGLQAKADDGAGTLVLTMPKPFPFFLNGLATVPIVCASGLDDKKKLVQGTQGSGPYVLGEVVADDHYTYEKRKGYTWGPGGAGTGEADMPDRVTFKVVPNETTAANLLLSKEINIAAVASADRERLAKAKLFRQDLQNVVGELYFNESKGRPTADENVRRALTMALDLPAVGKVLTGGHGTSAKGMVTLEPTPCRHDTVSGNLPPYDVTKAQGLLDAAGWAMGPDGVRQRNGKKLKLTFVHGTDASFSSAAEIAVAAWRKLGVQIDKQPKTDTAINAVLFESGAWDVTSNTLQVQFPSQLVPFLSGVAPTKGTNFAHIDNPDYERLAADASAKPDAEGCPLWKQAEEALIKRVDVVPFYDQAYPVWGNGARFAESANGIVPTTLRVAAR
jgi:peptide/nickel transport system substrate-binding protein